MRTSDPNDGSIVIGEQCIACGKCVEVCPVGALTYDTHPSISKMPRVFDSGVCIRCGHCVAVCPKEAILHSELPVEDCPLVESLEKPGWNDFVTFTRQRRSTRVFIDKPVPRRLIDKVLGESTRYSPTGHNRQATRIVILEGQHLRQVRETMNSAIVRLFKYLRLLRPFLPSQKYQSLWRGMRAFSHMIELGIDPATRNAPVALLFTSDDRIKESDVDAVVLSHQAMLSAEILGLGTCYFGALVNTLPYSKGLRRLLRLTSHRKIVCGLLLGHTNTRFRRTPSRKPIQFEVLSNIR
jgi:ferredoxin